MQKHQVSNPRTAKSEDPFDDLMASLLVLVTHHSLSQCSASLSPIVERLNKLCCHSEVEHYPEQLRVLGKMRQLWRTRLFEIEQTELSQKVH